ncbi:MAG: amino acid permease, partial [Cyanobacteria bacterium HKST-UBA05]|nr:amino acid permease [Cyanobacteria bacterium HKST-UBA05]
MSNHFFKMKRLLLGESIATQDEHHERLSIPAGLAIFASDALSSSAYATEEILLIFIVASHMPVLWGNILAIPIAVSIFVLLAIVVLSYRELIRAYPG